MADRAELRNKLVSYIEDAYAMENQIVETLEKQLDDVAKYPQVQAKIREHLDQTKQHRDRMEARLRAYDKTPPAIKSAMTGLLGNLAGAMSGVRPDAVAKDARDDYATEHMEIASYGLLIATAQLYGDVDTVHAAELNLADEIAMSRWLEQHLAEAAIFALQDDGIDVSATDVETVSTAVTQALQSASLGVGFGQGPSQPSAGTSAL